VRNGELRRPVEIKRIIYIIVGCICLGLGTVGVVIPVLPTTPFYLVTVYCFARSSKRLEDWFKSTKLYKKHLESFVEKKGMKVSTKAGILTSVTVLMGLGFFFMASVVGYQRNADMGGMLFLMHGSVTVCSFKTSLRRGEPTMHRNELAI